MQGGANMRKETRKYICAELLHYQQTHKDIERLKSKLEDMRLYTAFRQEYTTEQAIYLTERLRWCRQVTGAIAKVYAESSKEEKEVIQLKFWSPKPRPTDSSIASQLGMSTSTMYRIINSICKRIAMQLGLDTQ